MMLINSILKNKDFYWEMKGVSSLIRKHIIYNPLEIRYLSIWLKSIWNKNSHSPINTGLPWITYSGINYLKSIIRPEFKVFEYGGGGSTVFFSKQVAETISVEHNPEWFSIVKKKLKIISSKAYTINLVLPTKVKEKLPYTMKNYSSSTFEEYQYYSFEKYVNIINQYPRSHFDIVFVDGRARASCLY